MEASYVEFGCSIILNYTFPDTPKINESLQSLLTHKERYVCHASHYTLNSLNIKLPLTKKANVYSIKQKMFI